MDEELRKLFMDRYEEILQQEKDQLIKEGKTEKEAEEIIESFS